MSDFTILMADDSDSDRLFVKMALEKLGVHGCLRAVSSGEAAIAYIAGQGEYEDRQGNPRADVLLLDLCMPRCGGFQVLTWLRDHPESRIIPTIVFSSSALPEDVTKAYEMGANAFLVKPPDLDGLFDVVKKTYEFWSACELPTRVAA
jgi:CheY-like chemotaxis protein